MTTPALVPCGGCRRHVRASEASCPFCAQPIAASAGDGIVPEPSQRLSRAGMLAFAAAFLSTSACDPTVPTPPTPNTADSGMMQTIYGGPPPPLNLPTPTPSTPGPNDMPAPVYGLPPSQLTPPPTPPPTPTPPPAPPTPPSVRPVPRDDQRPNHAVPVPAYGVAPPPQLPPEIHRGSVSTRYGSPPRPADDVDL
ncbi:MAG: hypothetical protein Q8S73_22790 [Deltaproteobacteria bacterium]|nr:hypothetical protein [Myxococcales bacterium]MDP3216956.1 hypothetical protein [Deltaproteobacteria bacterium]